ncbi:MAG TPA: hypothetical protein VGF33_03225 [Caulobacteraceae bacterium]
MNSGSGSRARGGRIRWTPFTAVALMLAMLAGHAFARAVPRAIPEQRVEFGQSVISLSGPWKFRTGDDYRWSDPRWDDSTWESAGLASPQGSHDADIGLTGYVPGWGARGHPGYAGFAWYRLRVALGGADSAPLAIAGPTIVDGAYQVFIDGTYVDEVGDFRGPLPVVHSVRPRLIQLPTTDADGPRTVLITLRVWTPGPVIAGDAGGLRAAPHIGRLDDIKTLYQSQWIQVLRGYAVDAVEAAVLAILTLMVGGLLAVKRNHAGYAWLLAALSLTTLLRLNQVIYYWTGAESLPTFDILRSVILTPAALFSWLMAWRFWFDHSRLKWLTGAMAGLTGFYMAAALGSQPWLQPGNPAHGAFDQAVLDFRLTLAALYTFVVVAATWRNRSSWQGVLTFLAATCVAVGLFANELTMIGMTPVWFPFGVGVSRTQFAYAALVVILFAMVLEEFVRLASPPKPEPVADNWGPVPTPVLEPVRVMAGRARRPVDRKGGVP